MIKTLTNLLKQDKEKFVVPKGVQDCIPITAIYDDGIFRVGKDKYSKSFKFTDINFAVASREDKEAMFLEYSELLNSLDSGATTKLTINNRRLNRLDFEKTILIPETGDELDVYREEYNKMLLDKATGANAIVQDKYVTISINKKSVEDARTYFARVGADLIAHFARLGSKCVELETDERLRIVHDFFRVGEETAYHFNIKETRKKGHDFKDYVCPDTMEFEKDYFKMGNRYGRVLFLREYASYIKDSMVAELTDLNRNLMMSIDIVPVPTDEAVREAESRLLGVETNITNWQRKQNQNNNFSATVPYDMEQQKKEMKEFLDDLTTRDQRMMFAVLTMVHTADSKEQLDNDTEALLTTARKHLCQFAVLKYQQMDGLNTAMPFGTRKIDAFRTLTTESLAVFIPFRVQDIYHENGIYYGQNVISKNMIIADRRQLLNGNSFILGVSGGGKSFAAKGEIENIILSSNADVIIIDPERVFAACKGSRRRNHQYFRYFSEPYQCNGYEQGIRRRSKSGYPEIRVHYVPLRTAYRRHKPRSKAEIYHRPLYGERLPRLSAERIYRYCSYFAGLPCGTFETGRAGSKGNRPCYRAVYTRFFEYFCKADQC